MLGGVTNGNLTMGFRGLSFASFKPPLRRSIKHVIDFGLRPSTCSENPSFNHSLGSDILRLADLALPVVYKSPHFCRTGWGSRKLALSEIACAFDLPSQSVSCLTDAGMLSALFPLKLLTEPLQFLLWSLAGTQDAPTMVRTPSSRVIPTEKLAVLDRSLVAHFDKLSSSFTSNTSPVPLFLHGLPNPAGPGVPGKRIWFRDPPGMSWLPALGKFLPDSWCDDSNIADKAVKADDDSVPTHLWNQRIELVIPTATNQRGFHTLALIWQRKYMYRQFRGYLASRHGLDWESRLLSVRIKATQVARSVIKPPPRKRVRGGKKTSPLILLFR